MDKSGLISVLSIFAFIILNVNNKFAFSANDVAVTTTVATSSIIKQHPGTYVVLAPKTIRPNLPYAVSVNLLNSGSSKNKGPDAVTLKIIDNDNKTIAQQVQKNVKLGEPFAIKIDKIPNTLVEEVTYKVYVKGESDGKLLFENSEIVRFNSKSLSTFIQTDKAIYKPGSTVHIRIVTVYPDLKPFNGVANVKITDPNRNVVQQFSNATFDKGVIGKNNQLTLILVEEPPLGDWTITSEVAGMKTEKTFTVDKYVLPKFDVTVKPPPFITPKDDVAVTVTSKYTYGKGVGGSATLYIERPYYFGDSANKRIVKTTELDKNGEAIFRFTNAALKEQNLIDDYGGSLKLTATVTETLTAIQRNGTADLTIYRQRNKITINKPAETFQPGLDYTVSIAVTTQDDKPANLPANNRGLNLTITFVYPYVAPPPNATDFETKRERVTNKMLTLDENGTLIYTIKTPKGANSMRIDARFGTGEEQIDGNAYVDASKSPSESYLQISTEKTSVKAGESITFTVETTADVPSVTAQVMTRGYMVFVQNAVVTSKKAKITVPTTAEMAPKARLIVYGVRPDNSEIVVSAMDLKVEGLLKNKVSISVNPSRTEPGKNVTFTIKASPKSYIGLLAVDQSVLLLKSGNDITKDMIESEIAQYDTSGSNPGWWGGPWRRSKRMICWRGCGGWWGIGGKDAATIFENSGVVVLTDAFLYREPMPPIAMAMAVYSMEMAYAPMMNMDPANNIEDDSALDSSSSTTVPKIRSKFPETWIWSDQESNDNGQATYSAEVPDTITSWITTAFAVHDSDGLGVAPEPAKVEVFRPFFIRLNLPYSIKRGEKLALQVLLFNYMEKDQETTVTLDHNDNSPFDLIEKPGTEKKDKKASKNANVRVVTVPGGGGSTAVFFPLIPTKVGDLKLLVKAIGSSATDAVENILIVEAEGYPIYRNKPFIVDLTANNSWSTSIPLVFPANAIPGSQKATVTFVGDIMGPILENIEKLVKMPYGCGEQNMLNFVPNIVVTRYLKATNRLTDALKEKTKRYMEAGMQRELTYQRDDNSFSAFGKSDKAGSTWLTAFVARSFRQASPYIFVDADGLRKSLAFLKSQQKENGAFAENGEVHHKDMQGGAQAGGAALTAYVYLAFVENDAKNEEALKFLEHSLEHEKNNAYALAVITYALHLAGSSKKDDAFKLFEALAKTKDGLKYWSQNVSKDTLKTPSWYDAPLSVDVEMTAYALLTYMLRNDTSGGLPLVRWLVSKQNPEGGFSSTQDTVVGLQGLGAYAEKSYSPNIGASLTVRNGDQKHTFEVKADNAIVQQQLDLKNYDKPVDLEAKGRGVSFGQVSWHYNLPQLSDDQPFVCDKDVQQSGQNEVLVNLCCKYALPGRSNMALIEVESPSGFTVDQEKFNTLTKIKNLQRVELEKGDTKANIYLNSLGNEKICMNVTSQRQFSVAEQKPSLIKVQDYYAPDKQIRFDYSLKTKSDLNEICGGDCWKGQNGGSPAKTSGQHKGKAKAKKARF